MGSNPPSILTLPCRVVARNLFAATEVVESKHGRLGGRLRANPEVFVMGYLSTISKISSFRFVVVRQGTKLINTLFDEYSIGR